jgi:quercetin dioxygenase-like cupin family protein
MENKYIDTTTQHRSEVDHTIDGSLIKINIPQFINQIKNEKQWIEKDRNAITVFKTNNLSIVLIGLKKNATMPKHKVDGTLSLQVLEGAIQVDTNEQSIELNQGQMLALNTSFEHSILAIEETFFLLTLTTTPTRFTD